MGGSTVPSPLMSGKRRRDGPKFYAVRVGHSTGVFKDWDTCKTSITGFKGAAYKSFPSQKEAEDFVAGRPTTSSATGSPAASARFYGVASGRETGVYTSWDDAQQQIVGVKNPKYKKFTTRAEAEAFVKSGGQLSPRATNVQAAESEPPKKRTRKESNDEEETSSEIIATMVLKPAGAKQTTAPKDPLKIYTDGSALGNGQKGATAGVGVFFAEGDKRNLSEPLAGGVQTNQRAELTAILRALEISSVDQGVNIYTDSSYSINCVTVWFKSWERNDWKTSQGKPVMNKDLVKAILAKIRARQEAKSITVLNWIKGHSNDPGNEAADRLAVAAAQRVRNGSTPADSP